MIVSSVPFFELLVGTDYVRKMIEGGKSADEMKAMMEKMTSRRFKVQRKAISALSKTTD